MTNQEYLRDFVRREDHDRYLVAQFVPADRREDVLALIAFNAELARIRNSVSETMIGRIRLQWWRDTVDSIYDGHGPPKGNPITGALALAITRRGLVRTHFDALLAARAGELDSDDAGSPFSSLADLETFAEGTASQLLYAVLDILGVDDAGARLAARHVGIGVGLTGLLRAVLTHAGENRLVFPPHTLRPHDIAAAAVAHLQAARGQRVPRFAVPALLGATVATGYLNVMKAASYDASDGRLARLRPDIIRLIWNAWRGVF